MMGPFRREKTLFQPNWIGTFGWEPPPKDLTKKGCTILVIGEN
jgi:hypothetical protein